ncbi:MAG: VOC family protein [Candidatus Zixiibacteriota bacterium]
MSDTKPAIGTIGWIDLTVENAVEVKDFYSKVVGWSASPISMGDYDDFTMMPPGGSAPAAGICHSRGGNKDIPPVWMLYIIVANIDDSIAACAENGGRLLNGPKTMGNDRYCFIEDPAGVTVALFEKG